MYTLCTRTVSCCTTLYTSNALAKVQTPHNMPSSFLRMHESKTAFKNRTTFIHTAFPIFGCLVARHPSNVLANDCLYPLSMSFAYTYAGTRIRHSPSNAVASGTMNNRYFENAPNRMRETLRCNVVEPSQRVNCPLWSTACSSEWQTRQHFVNAWFLKIAWALA